MKRLLFSLPSIAALAVVSGCGTTTGPLKSDDGNALTTATGAPIIVVETPNNPSAQSKVDDGNASFEERQKEKTAAESRPLEISRTDAEMAIEARAVVLEKVRAELMRIRSSSNLAKELKTIVVFVNGRPQLLESVIVKYAPKMERPLSSGAIVAIRAIVEREIEEMLAKDIYPKLISDTMAKVDPLVRKAVEEGKFALAREYIWNASTYGIPTVDNAVREKAYELMHGLVNPTNWQKIEPKICRIRDAAIESKTFDDGIKKLRDLEVSAVVREYSAYINKKLEAVKAELIKLGIGEEDLKPILSKQAEIIAAAENITDIRDEFLTLEKARTEQHEVEARKDPALADYYSKLDAFHDILIKYNCTKENADRIVTNLDRDIIALLKLLSSPAVLQTDEFGEKVALQLGTRSLNNRIHALVAESIAKLIEVRDAEKRKAYLDKLAKAKSDLEKQVRALVAEGKFEEARELIWNASITGDGEWDGEMFAFGIALLRDIVNPADWNRIEAEINAQFKALSESGDFEKLRDYLQNYPLIRQHTVKLDEQLAKVKAEAEALGADSDAAAKIAEYVCKNMVTESEQLVDHIDQLVSDAAAAGKELDKSKLQKELEIYAVKLAAYHMTPENVAAVVEKLKSELDKLITNPTNPATTHLVLGTNAVNDRIRALTAKLLEMIPNVRHEWEDKEHARVMTDLEKRVRAAVKEQRFDDARGYIRDEKLIGRADLDLSLYELRVGLLDSCVNPAQLDFLLADIDAKIAEFVEAEDYQGAMDFIAGYPYVHDHYEEIEHALAAVKAAMLALEISPAESEHDEKVRFFLSIQETLEKRRESWKPDRDLSEVEKALAQVAKALFAHLNKHPELIDSERTSEFKHILEDIAALDRTVTTWELNESLRAKLSGFVPTLESARAIQRYAELLSTIDKEVSFDSQIAIAEEAISRQLGVVCDKASFKVNALLGEYARVFRLMKKGVKVDAEMATTLLLGGAYLDQAQVLSRAIELGANVNGTSSRDPRKRTALAIAVDTGHSSLVEALVKAGAALDAVDADGNAIMHYAAKSGNLSVLKAVVAGAPVNVKNACGNTPLAVSVVRNQPAVVEFLVGAVAEADRKAFVDSANNDGDTAFDIAAKFGSRDVLDALAAAGATYSTKDLILAEKADNIAVAQWLVNQGLDVNAKGVMEAACPATLTGRYLVHEGGVDVGHACDACKPSEKKADEGAANPGDKPGCACKPVPVDVLLVPQCEK